MPAAGFYLLHDRLSLLPGCVSLDVVGGRLGFRLVDSLLFGGLPLGVDVMVSGLLFSGRLRRFAGFSPYFGAYFFGYSIVDGLRSL